MIDKKFVKKILRDILHPNRSLGDHNLMHPEREWFIGLGTAVLAICIGAYWILHLYTTYNEVEVTANLEKINDQSIYRDQEVKQALKELSERQVRYGEIRQELEAGKPTPHFIVTTTEPELESKKSTSTEKLDLEDRNPFIFNSETEMSQEQVEPPTTSESQPMAQ